MPPLHRYATACATLTLTLALLSTQPTHALNIIPQLDDEGENPSYDSDGTRLLAIFNAAAQIWERLLPSDSNEYEIDVSWGDLDNGTLGQHTFEFGGDNNIRIDPTPRTSGGDTLNWFIDSSPTNHSEFDFSNPSPADPNNQGMTIYSDLSASQKSNWFFGNAPPQALEVGYRGAAIGTLPPEGSIGGSMGTVDMLSVVLHEIGHELGINSGDFDNGWELKPIHVLNIPDVGIEETTDDGGGHFQITMSLMNQVTPSSTRVLPTATDVLAVAWDEDIDTVDLQRKHFSSNVNTNWNSAPNWVGRRVPDTDDDAYLMRGTPVNLTANASAGTLTLDNGTDLTTLIHTLTVPGQTTLNPGSKINISSGGTANLTTLNIVGGSAGLGMQGGTANLAFADNNASSGISGRGTVSVSGFFANDGSILAIGGHLHFQGIGSIDLDGFTDTGDVLAFSDITFDNPIDDNFDGNMTIDDNTTVSIRDWTLGSPGNLNLNGDTSNPAELTSPTGFTADIRGDITADKLAIISSFNAQFYSTSNVSIPNSNDTLRLTSPGVVNFRGANFTGLGGIEQHTTIQVLQDTTIATEIFDWGNSTTSNQHNLLVFPGQTLTIDSLTAISTRNQYRGDLILNSGNLAVNFDDPWELPDDIISAGGIPFPAVPGRLIMTNAGLGTPTLSGQEVLIKNVVNVSGGLARIEAPITTSNTANVLVNPGATLALAGLTKLNAGFFNGAGTIQQLADIESFQTVVFNVGTYDWGNSNIINGTNATTIAKDTQFIILAPTTGTTGNPYHGVFNIYGGQLHTEFDDPWTLPDATGSGPSLKPRGVINFPIDFGFGTIDKSLITGTPNQQMIVHGDINLFQPRAEIHIDAQFHPTANVQIGQTGTFEDATLAFFGLTEFFGGTFQGPGAIEQNGDIYIRADTNFANNEFDWGNSSPALITPPNQLTIGPNATFTVDTPVLGDLSHNYTGVINIVGGHLAVNTPGQWTLPEQNLFRGGTLNFLNNRGVSGPLPSTLSGQTLFVHGRVHVEADLAVINNTTAFFDTSKLTFENTPTLNIGPTGNLEIHNIPIDHADANATIASDTGANLTWGFNSNIHIQGNTTGSLTFDLAPATNVSLSSVFPPTLTIDPGATLHIAGQTDPLTSSFIPDTHVPVINNSTTSLNISNPNVTTTTVTGVGHTHIMSGGTLNVESINQDRITIDPGGTLNLTTDNTLITTTTVLLNIGTLNNTGSTTVIGPVTGAGDFNAPTGETLAFKDIVAASGNFPDLGTIQFRAEYDPNGNAHGTNAFGGPLQFRSSATLHLDAQTPLLTPDTPTPGTDHDQLNITGPVTLNGTLEIDFTPSGIFGDGLPPLGTEFNVMNFASRTPNTTPTMFDFITGTNISTTFALAPLFTDTNLTLRATIPGDLNLDNKVSVADLSFFALNFSTTPGLHDEATNQSSWLLGDFNTDGAITVADLSLLALNFGFDATDPTAGSPLSLHAAAALAGIEPSHIPTPATAIMIAPCLLPLLPTRTQRPTIQ